MSAISDDLSPTKRTTRNPDTTLTAIENPSQDDAESGDEENDRGEWGNHFEFILSTMGMAVGLGNIWRFPTRAYNNGGSAFLIPYITCALLFGLPAVYLEFLLGQYHRTTAPNIFRRFAPILQGVGWMAVAVSSCVAIYYVILIGWTTIYMASIIVGHTNYWNRCDNEWNDLATCIDLSMQSVCRDFNSTSNESANLSSNKSYVYFNNTCVDKSEIANISTITATEQYFFNYVVQPSAGFLDFNSVNTKAFLGVTVCWIIVTLIIWKGVDYMGKASYVTVILPYSIIVILFFRGITLDGASDGLYYYLGKPDWSKLFTPSTWGEALKQLCFSLGIGYGGLIGLASFSKPNNNCYRDALIVIVGDTTMSIIGGAAVFSTLGFLAKQKGCEVADVVNSGLSLAFVAFPEAMGRMPLPWLWSFLFFIMLFFLGISTEVAYVNVFCSALCDQFVSLRKRKWVVSVGWCMLLYVIGLIMVTDGGFYWFIMFDEYAAGVSSCVAVTAEVLVVAYIYGRKNIAEDMREMFGPSLNKFTRIFGIHSPYFGYNWMFVTPSLGIILICLASIREYPFNGNPDMYPVQFDIIGWIICLLPVSMVPIFALLAYIEFVKNGHNLRGLMMKQRDLKSYKRLYHQLSDSEQKEHRMILTSQASQSTSNREKYKSVSNKDL